MIFIKIAILPSLLRCVAKEFNIPLESYRRDIFTIFIFIKNLSIVVYLIKQIFFTYYGFTCSHLFYNNNNNMIIILDNLMLNRGAHTFA